MRGSSTIKEFRKKLDMYIKENKIQENDYINYELIPNINNGDSGGGIKLRVDTHNQNDSRTKKRVISLESLPELTRSVPTAKYDKEETYIKREAKA